MIAYALGLGGKPRSAALLALSGFVPTVPGPSSTSALPCRPSRSATARSTRSSRSTGGDARGSLGDAGADVLYRESPGLGHSIDPAFLAALVPWLQDVVGA